LETFEIKKQHTFWNLVFLISTSISGNTEFFELKGKLILILFIKKVTYYNILLLANKFV
jgi:hypothetical protein